MELSEIFFSLLFFKLVKFLISGSKNAFGSPSRPSVTIGSDSNSEFFFTSL